MLTYVKGWAGVWIIFRIAGTSWPYGLLPGIFSAALGLFLSMHDGINATISNEKKWIDNPYPFQLFAYLVGFCIVFRTNFAYQRYWEGIDAIQRMGAKLLDGASMAVAFDAPGDPAQPYLCSSVVDQPSKGGGYFPLDESPRRYSAPVVGGGGGGGDGGGLPSTPEEEEKFHQHRLFFAEIVHLFSLLHAACLLHLRGDGDLDNLEVTWHEELMALCAHNPSRNFPSVVTTMSLGNFSPKYISRIHSVLKLEILGKLKPGERETLEAADGKGKPLSGVARVSMVECWIMRRLISRQKHDKVGDMEKTSPPIVSRMYQVISDGHLGFSQAAKIAETPFPFPYQNVTREFLWMFALIVPFVVNGKVLHWVARFVVNLLIVWAYFSLAWVGDNLEDPFLPYDANEIPLLQIQRNFNARLLSLGAVPQHRVAAEAAARAAVKAQEVEREKEKAAQDAVAQQPQRPSSVAEAAPLASAAANQAADAVFQEAPESAASASSTSRAAAADGPPVALPSCSFPPPEDASADLAAETSVAEAETLHGCMEVAPAKKSSVCPLPGALLGKPLASVGLDDCKPFNVSPRESGMEKFILQCDCLDMASQINGRGRGRGTNGNPPRVLSSGLFASVDLSRDTSKESSAPSTPCAPAATVPARCLDPVPEIAAGGGQLVANDGS